MLEVLEHELGRLLDERRAVFLVVLVLLLVLVELADRAQLVHELDRLALLHARERALAHLDGRW